MMRLINVHEERDCENFAREAAEHFATHPTNYTYARGEEKTQSDILPGELLAIRWNPWTVLVVRVSDHGEPRLYPTDQMNVGKLPPLQPSPNQ